MRVKIRDASVTGDLPFHAPGLPQFAFAGRSNVGKSSLINTLLDRKSLVRTSKVPGKTRAVNFFQVDMVDLPSICLVDLPGYGYAKAPKGMSKSWNELASQYLSHNEDLKLVMLLVDITEGLERRRVHAHRSHRQNESQSSTRGNEDRQAGVSAAAETLIRDLKAKRHGARDHFRAHRHRHGYPLAAHPGLVTGLVT